jgi:hypothetical protein
MKLFFFFMLFSLNTFAHNRQYLQCTSLDDFWYGIAVVNLYSDDSGTLFLSAGMETDDYVLADLIFTKSENSFLHYQAIAQNRIQQEVTFLFPENFRGIDASRVDFTLLFPNYLLSYRCFSVMKDKSPKRFLSSSFF